MRVPWTARRPNQLIFKEINPEYSFYFVSGKNLLSSNSEFHSRWVVYEVYVVEMPDNVSKYGSGTQERGKL